MAVIATMVCPQCEAPAKVSVQVVTNDMPPFERYECDACGKRMLTIDLVPKYGMSIARGHHPRGGGGSTTTFSWPAGGFPHIWMQCGTAGVGTPVMTSPGVFDMTLINKMARWDMVNVNVHPFADGPAGNLAIVSLLKAANPAVKVLWYDTIQQRFLFIAPGTQWGDEWTLAEPLRFFFTGSGDSYPDHDPTTAFWDMVDSGVALANIWKQYTHAKADGYMFDYFIGKPGNWTGGIDYGLAGYANVADLNTANSQGLDDFAVAMLGEGLLWGNRGVNNNGTQDSTIRRLRGEVAESWDPNKGNPSAVTPEGLQQLPLGGTGSGLFASFDAAMTLIMSWQGSSPTGDGTILLKGETDAGPPTASYFNKLVRYTLGSACIAGGFAYIGHNRDGTNDPNMWADEYSVDANGASDGVGLLGNKGWLGRPTEFGYKDSGSGMYVRHFDRGVVVVNGSLSSSASIDLGKPYRRLRGVYDTAVNDGSSVQNLSVPPKDARFLLA